MLILGESLQVCNTTLWQHHFTIILAYKVVVLLELCFCGQIAIAVRPVVEKVGLWKSVRGIARLYDAFMGMVIFIPIALLSWFPFISTFQTRLVFNQAFSRGLEISVLLAGDQPNASF